MAFRSRRSRGRFGKRRQAVEFPGLLRFSRRFRPARKRKRAIVSDGPAVDAACKLFYAAPIERLAWKHSRQNTGRPWVGRKGTVVSLPHCEHVVFVSARGWFPPPPASALFALQALHRLGSFLNPLSAKNICSPAVKTNSAPHSEHFRTLSWNSMSRSPWTPFRAAGTDSSYTGAVSCFADLYAGVAGHGSPGPTGEESEPIPNFSA